jgi:cupin superfamily acireductone dioxygenase involved in methionine salvage
MKKKIKNKNKIDIGSKSVDDETDPDKEDKMKRKISALVMWYLPVIDHLKRVFSNPRDAELVRWHSEKHMENDEEIQYPMDGTQWKFFDLQYP